MLNLPSSYLLTTNSATGSSTVTHIETTLPHGIRPTADITLKESAVQEGRATKYYIIRRITRTGDAITSTIKPGPLDITSIPELERGQPDRVLFIPGAKRTDGKTTTKTTTFDDLPRPTADLHLPGPEPPLGGDETVIEVPAAGKDFEKPADWSCPCNKEPKIVFRPQSPQPAPDVEVVDSKGNITTAPASIFPCSESDKDPCRGKQAAPWTSFSVEWNAEYKQPGPPAPFSTTSNFDYDTILTLTDDIYQAEHFNVKVDGEKIGETHEDGWKNECLYCGKDAEACMAKGFSHGSFWIPGGKHELSFQWTDGKFKADSGLYWWYGAGQYRFDRPCECGETRELKG